MFELKYPLFDGERVLSGAAVTVEDGQAGGGRRCRYLLHVPMKEAYPQELAETIAGKDA